MKYRDFFFSSGGALWAASLVLLLAACAGEGGVGSGGTGISAGTVGGFSSVVVEGTKFDDSSATIELDIDLGAPESGTSASVGLGHTVEVTHAEGSLTAQTIRIAPEVVGMVEALGSTGLTVAGQAVRVSVTGALPTVYEGLTDASELNFGDALIIYGQRDATDTVLATRIERADSTTALMTRVSGTVRGLSASGNEFRIGQLIVGVDAQTVRSPRGLALSDGLRVTVSAATVVSGGKLQATHLRAEDLLSSNYTPQRVGGIIQNLSATQQSFTLRGLTVDYNAQTTVSGGSLSDLANGRIVRVNGVRSEGRWVASAIEIQSENSANSPEITGVISAYSSSGSFRVRGVLVDASTSGAQFVGAGASNLTDGTVVKIKGSVVNGVVRAERVEFSTQDDSRTTAFEGEIKNLSAQADQFSVIGVTVRLASDVRIVDRLGQTLSRSSLRDGLTAKVAGAFQGGVFTAILVELEANSAQPLRELAGWASYVNLDQQTLRVNGVTAQWSSSTRIDGDLRKLRAGSRIEVQGRFQGTTLMADTLEIQR